MKQMNTTKNIKFDSIPADGISISASPGKVMKRIHLDLADDGISLAMVGAASAALKKGNRHSLTIKKAGDGISLAMVGAATAAK